MAEKPDWTPLFPHVSPILQSAAMAVAVLWREICVSSPCDAQGPGGSEACDAHRCLPEPLDQRFFKRTSLGVELSHEAQLRSWSTRSNG